MRQNGPHHGPAKNGSACHLFAGQSEQDRRRNLYGACHIAEPLANADRVKRANHHFDAWQLCEAHIALRAGAKPDHPDYVVTHFGDIGFNLYAHDSYLVRRGAPDVSDGFEGHVFVLPEFPHDRLPFGSWIKDNICPEMVALSSRDIGVIEEAISAGLGIGFMGSLEAQKCGNLHPVLPAQAEWKIAGWLVTHVDLHHTQKVQAMLASITANGL